MQMTFQTGSQILCQSHVVKLLFSIKSIDPVSTPNVLFDDLLMPPKSIPGDVFEVLADEMVHLLTLSFILPNKMLQGHVFLNVGVRNQSVLPRLTPNTPGVIRGILTPL